MKRLDLRIGAKAWGAWFAVVSLLVVFWYVIAIQHPVSLWGVNEDAPVMSWAHGVNIDAWMFLGEPRGIGQAQYYQPGMPYQILSWITYRLTLPGWFSDARQGFLSTFQDPSGFYFGFQIVPLLLSALALFLLARKGKELRWHALLFVLVVYFASRPALHYGTFMFFNESITLLLSVLFFGAASWVFRDSNPSAKLVLIAGAMGGINYLHKLNYIVWTFAFFPAAFAAGLVGYWSWRAAIKNSAIFLGSAAATVFCVGFLMLGFSGMGQMIAGHFGIFMGSGIYGSGDQTIVNKETMLQNVFGLWHQDGNMLLILLALSAFGFEELYLRRRDWSWVKSRLPEGVLLVTAASVMILALVKHYLPYYVVSIGAVVPMLALWVLRGEPRKVHLLLFPAVAWTIWSSVHGHYDGRLKSVALEEQTLEDEKEILKSKLEDGEVRLWVYRVLSPLQQRSFLLSFASLPKLQSDLIALQGLELWASPWHPNVQVGSQSKLIQDVNWRYFVAQKETMNWMSAEAHPWVNDPRTKKTVMKALVVYERPDRIIPPRAAK